MPLSAFNHPAARVDLGWVGFPMTRPEGNTIAVWVSDNVLDGIESPPPSDDSDYISRCESYRNVFEEQASNLFDNGQTAGPIRINS
jgi:hypothetical protein